MAQIVLSEGAAAATPSANTVSVYAKTDGKVYSKDDAGTEYDLTSAGVSDGDKGDITVTSSGTVWTIDNNVVSNAKLADVATATIKGRTTAGTGDPEDLTATQATALLDGMVGDSGSGGTKGLVPAPAAGDAAANKFLKADGTWTALAGGGDATKAGIQAQSYTRATTGGTSTAYTLDLTPNLANNNAGQRVRPHFHTGCGAAPTLAVDGLAAMPLRYTSAAGTLVAPTITQLPADFEPDCVSDGTYWVMQSTADNLTAIINGKKGSDVASASTTDLDTVTGDLIDVTGTTTITAITLAEGHERTVRFTGVLTLTNGASLVLPGGANITTAAGDFATFRGYSAGVVRCSNYSAASSAPSSASLPTAYIYGLTLANNASDATNDIDIAAGKARDSTDTVDIVLASALTKRLDATWTVGTNQGMLDTGTVGNGTYHLFLIKRSDTGVVDVLASLSSTGSGTCTMTIASPCVVSFTDHGLQVGSSFEFSTTGALPTGVTAGTTYYVISTGFGVDSFQFSTTQGGAAVNTSGTQSGTHTLTHKPIMPASYNYKRRIGSIMRASAAIVGFVKQGLNYVKKTPTLDINTGTSGTTVTTRTMAVPVGVKSRVLVQAYTSSATSNMVHITSTDETDSAPTDGASAAPYNFAGSDSTTNFYAYTIRAFVGTNNSAQIRSRNSANSALRIHCYGWEDYKIMEGL